MTAETEKQETPAQTQNKSRTTAALLALFLGGFGAHNFYLGAKNTGFAQLGFSLLTAGLGSLVALVDAIILFQMSDEQFATIYGGEPIALWSFVIIEATPPEKRAQRLRYLVIAVVGLFVLGVIGALTEDARPNPNSPAGAFYGSLNSSASSSTSRERQPGESRADWSVRMQRMDMEAAGYSEREIQAANNEVREQHARIEASMRAAGVPVD